MVGERSIVVYVQMSLLYSQLDDMDSSLDNLQAEVSDIAENEELWTPDDPPVTFLRLIYTIKFRSVSE